MKSIFIKKNILILSLLIYFLIGSIYSINTGLSHDEFHEQRNWEYNVELFNNFFYSTPLSESFLNYPDKYYGIGFQIISQPIQFLLSNFIKNFQNVDSTTAHLLGKHFVSFCFFLISGFFVYLILSKIVKNNFFLYTATSIYLLYPYLLGHSFFNPKDIPFLTIWLICTYLSTNVFSKLSSSSHLYYKQIFLISLFTALLLSIRISGILIFIQYLFTFIIYLNSEKIKYSYFLKKNFIKFVFFLLSTLILTYLFYPVFWNNPLAIFDAINFMSNHFNNVCTLTLGKCIFSKNLEPTYIPIWLLVKLPAIILFGILLLPFTEKNIFLNNENKIIFGTILLSSMLIPLILIFRKVHLYDELRQIIFLIPLLFITGITSLFYFSKRFFYFVTFITIIIFLIENIKIYPYQYIWFNTPSRILNLSKNFELDYWGISGKELSKQVVKINKNVNKKPCVLSIWTTSFFLKNKKYSCIDSWSNIDKDYPRPFFAAQNVRNLKKSKPFKCETIYESKFKLLFTNEEFITGRLLKCI